jgi:hypothetical protein
MSKAPITTVFTHFDVDTNGYRGRYVEVHFDTPRGRKWASWTIEPGMSDEAAVAYVEEKVRSCWELMDRNSLDNVEQLLDQLAA